MGEADSICMGVNAIFKAFRKLEGFGGRASESESSWKRGSRTATIGLSVVLLAVMGFSIWSSQAMTRAARDAVAASRLSDHYVFVSKALAAEESLERKYRLEPGPEVRARSEQAAKDLVDGLALLQRDGSARDRATVEYLAALHLQYRESMTALFAAVDRGDAQLAQHIDTTETEPSFDAIESTVQVEARDHHAAALLALAHLQTLGSATSLATPLVFLAGTVLVVIFSSVLRRVRRQLNRERERAVYDSLHDALTGLPNRTLLEDRLDQALRAGRRDGSTTGLLLLDLDRFKEVNDTLGHRCGDRVLSLVGERLEGELREVDTVARLGGDEFAIVLPDIDGVNGASTVARRLCDALAQPFKVDDLGLHVEASVGVVISGKHGEDFGALLQHADIAMYVAKTHKLCVSVYDPSVDAHSPERLALLSQLQQGLESGQLVLHYQPKVSLSTGETRGVEALVRWQHPDQGLTMPNRFIALAEHTGLIGTLTRYVIDAALAQVRAWSDAGHSIPVAVNLSARNLLDEHLPDQVGELLLKHSVPGGMLTLEVTESAVMTDPTRSGRVLCRLQALGTGISIDDFGVGYTSLAQLKSLPVTEIKVDRSLVASMNTDHANAHIVQSVIDIGRNLGLTTVAEGVENEEVREALAETSCDLAQGYLFSQALPADDVLAWCVRRAAGEPLVTSRARPGDHGLRGPVSSTASGAVSTP